MKVAKIQATGAKIQAFNTILMKSFPFMNFKCLKEIFLIDAAKINDFNEGMLQFITESVENITSKIEVNKLQNHSEIIEIKQTKDIVSINT